MIDLNEKRAGIISVATRMFDEITSIPTSIRTDTKVRKGIKVLVRQPGTRNLVLISIKEPSEAAQFFAVEKAVRSHIYFENASQNSEDASIMQFAGSVTVGMYHFYGHTDSPYSLQASVSGLKAEEDVTVAIAVITEILKESNATMKNVADVISEDGGQLPYCFYDKDHYLHTYFVS
ncbi:MAG: hypothetical protein ACLFNO_03805 [Parcubacteria group bacterium]